MMAMVIHSPPWRSCCITWLLVSQYTWSKVDWTMKTKRQMHTSNGTWSPCGPASHLPPQAHLPTVLDRSFASGQWVSIKQWNFMIHRVPQVRFFPPEGNFFYIKRQDVLLWQNASSSCLIRLPYNRVILNVSNCFTLTTYFPKFDTVTLVRPEHTQVVLLDCCSHDMCKTPPLWLELPCPI